MQQTRVTFKRDCETHIISITVRRRGHTRNYSPVSEASRNRLAWLVRAYGHECRWSSDERGAAVCYLLQDGPLPS
jgi:hypothetical protein